MFITRPHSLVLRLIRLLSQLSLFFLLLFSCADKKESYSKKGAGEDPNIYGMKADADFLGDGKCKECHQEEYSEWEGSHHQMSMLLADSTSVKAPFQGEIFDSQGVRSTFYSKPDGFYVTTEGPDGKPADFKIEYTFGIAPLQQYIVKFPDGHYQCLRTAWDTEKGEWFDLYPDFKVVHSEWLHWTKGGLNWNTMCSDCHSTNVRKNYKADTHSYDTQYALINVSCEACHGPGKGHVAEVERLGDAYEPNGSFQMTQATPPKALVDQCARCHVLREQVTDGFDYKGSLLDHYFPRLIDTLTYFPDGQILGEDYVYGSFVQSKMYHNNVSCKDCHNSHSLTLKAEGNALCLQCHESSMYDTERHHFHSMGQEGAACINCHMPGRIYMGNDFRRDHSFRVPRPDQSIAYGTPNACMDCHAEKGNAWAWEAYKKWYGKAPEGHFSDLLAAGLTAPNGSQLLKKLAQDTLQPDIARASAIHGMHENALSEAEIQGVLAFLKDDAAVVRGATLDFFGEQENSSYTNHFWPLLKDAKRAVRVKAYFALAGQQSVPKGYETIYKKVGEEFAHYLKATSDFVGGRVKQGNYHLKKGELAQAIASYESAQKLDALDNNVRMTLGNLYYRNKQYDKAEKAFRTIIEQEPEFGATYFTYALLLAEQERFNEAAQQLESSIAKAPDNQRAYYNLCLIYDRIGEKELAYTTALKGLKMQENNVDLMYTLAFLYHKNGDSKQARPWVVKLIRLQPENQQFRAFLNEIDYGKQGNSGL